MNKIILYIKNELEKQALSETALAKKAGLNQKSVNNLLSGKTKRLNLETIKKIQNVLGIVADPEAAYGVATIHRSITPDEEKLLQLLKNTPDAHEAIKTFIALPDRKRKIHLGKMLEDLEKLEEERKM